MACAVAGAERRFLVRKISMLSLLLVISSIWLQGQDAGQAAGKTSDANTLQGCLQNSRGNYALTEENGTTHQLAGAANKLGHQVGRQIEVTGKPGMRMADSTLVGAASSASEHEVFEVKTVKRIADACK